MTTIAPREPRRHLSDVLRRAERGERFLITVDGRPVAELGPRTWVSRDRVLRLMSGPATPTLLQDVKRLECGLSDPVPEHTRSTS